MDAIQQFADCIATVISYRDDWSHRPSSLKGKINEAYLNGFINASYKETLKTDPNSDANTFRQAMGMNQVGTMTSSATMFANRYPFEDALKMFGAVKGFGAQMPK